MEQSLQQPIGRQATEGKKPELFEPGTDFLLFFLPCHGFPLTRSCAFLLGSQRHRAVKIGMGGSRGAKVREGFDLVPLLSSSITPFSHFFRFPLFSLSTDISSQHVGTRPREGVLV